MNTKHNIETWAAILLGVSAIIAIISIFEDDNSKIVSKRGRRILSNKDKMKDINEKIQKLESKSQYKDILI